MFSATWIRVDARVLTKGTMHVTLQRGEGLKGVEKGGTKVRSVIMVRRFIAIARRLITGRRAEGRDEGAIRYHGSAIYCHGSAINQR